MRDLRHELRHWAIRQDWLAPRDMHIFCDRGDAYLEMTVGNAERLADPEFYAAWAKMVNAQLDKYVDEAKCRETGGHDFHDGVCLKCYQLEGVG